MKDTLQTIGKMVFLMFTNWWFMGHPIPSTLEEVANLILGLATMAFAEYRNFDLNDISRRFTAEMRLEKMKLKLINDEE